MKMSAADTREVKRLEAELLKTRNAIYAVTEPYAMAEADAFVGRFFKYHDSSGSGKDRQEWNGYLKVVRNDNSNLMCVHFVFRPHEIVYVEMNTLYMVQTLEGYTEIGAGEFVSAWSEMAAKVTAVVTKGWKPARNGFLVREAESSR